MAQELRDIGDQLVPVPSSNAKKHHFVPQFWLRRFTPANSKQIFRIDRRRGAPKLVAVKTAAQQDRLYGVRDAMTGSYDNRIEGLFGLIESEAAPAFDAIVARRELSSSEAFALEMLLGIQLMRGPRTLNLLGERAEALGNAAFEAAARDRSLLRSAFQQAHGRAAREEEVAKTQEAMQTLLAAGGRLVLEEKRYAGLETLIDNLFAAAEFIGRMDRLLVAPSSARFVLNDVGFARHADGLVFPLHPDLAVVFLPPEDPQRPRTRAATLDGGQTRDLNLRLYAWAEHSIFGNSAGLLASLRHEARRHPHRVRRPSADENPLVAALARGDENDLVAALARGGILGGGR